jgi:hypothetical protein
MLRDTSHVYLDDRGFTANVMAALPATRRRAERRRLVLLWGSALLGTALTLAVAGTQLVNFGALVAGRLAEWGAVPVPGLGPAFTLASVVVALAIGAAGWWAWARSR